MEINNNSVGDLASDLLSEDIDLDTFKKAMVKHNEKALVKNFTLGMKGYINQKVCKYKPNDKVIIINYVVGVFIVDKILERKKREGYFIKVWGKNKNNELIWKIKHYSRIKLYDSEQHDSYIIRYQCFGEF